MTTDDMIRLLMVAHDDLRAEIQNHPDISYATHGTAVLIQGALLVASKMQPGLCQRQHLATIAQIGADTLAAAFLHRPHLVESAKLLHDIASSLQMIADAARPGVEAA